MKHFFLFFILIVKVFPVFAMYLGNPVHPSFPKKGFFSQDKYPFTAQVAYVKDHVFKKAFKPLELTRNANQARLTANWQNFLEIFVSAGEEKIGFKNEKASELRRGVLNWSLGGRALLIEWGSLSFCASGGYLTSYPEIDAQSCRYSEWEIGLGLAKSVDFFSFYALGGFSKGFLYFSDARFVSSQPYLLALGASFFTKKGFSANGELRFFGEKALGFDFEFKF